MGPYWKSRSRGESLLGLSTRAEDEAVDCFLRAVDVARRRQARPLELRGSIRLCHLWARQGKREDARRLLGEIYRLVH